MYSYPVFVLIFESRTSRIRYRIANHYTCNYVVFQWITNRNRIFCYLLPSLESAVMKEDVESNCFHGVKFETVVAMNTCLLGYNAV
jgi:hypothetical protein